MDEVKHMLHSHVQRNRSMVIDQLSLLRTLEALGLLIKVFDQEYDAKIRYKAIASIWVQAALIIIVRKRWMYCVKRYLMRIKVSPI